MLVPDVILRQGDSVARVSSHGSRVTHWLQDSREILFYSSAGSEHGGVPVLFPQFGAFGDGKFHGFVRDQDWTLIRISESEIRAALKSTQCHDHVALKTSFECNSRITLTESSLQVSLTVINLADGDDLSFTAGLHTYVSVTDFDTAHIIGLQGDNYLDAGNGLAPRVDLATHLVLGGELDRVYVNSPGPVCLKDSNKVVIFGHSGFEDLVIWNPGPEAGATFHGLAQDEWRKFVCIEAAQIQNPVTLKPGESWTGLQTLTVR